MTATFMRHQHQRSSHFSRDLGRTAVQTHDTFPFPNRPALHHPSRLRTATTAQYHRHDVFCPIRIRNMTSRCLCALYPAASHLGVAFWGIWCEHHGLHYTKPRRTVRHHFQISKPQSNDVPALSHPSRNPAGRRPNILV